MRNGNELDNHVKRLDNHVKREEKGMWEEIKRR